MNDILLLTDFSELSRFARSLADKVAYNTEAKLHVLKIVEVPTLIQINKNGELIDSIGDDLSSLKKQKVDAEKLLIEWTSQMISTVNTKVVYGRFGHSVFDYVNSSGIELVIMGIHGI